MHRTFVFPIKCTIKQSRFNEVKMEKIGKEDYILGSTKNANFYDAFDEIKIIPSLIELIEGIERGDNKEKSIKKWILQWGPLNGILINVDGSEMFGQSVSSFWYQAKTFYDFWNLYKHVLNNDFNYLRTIIEDIKKEKLNVEYYKMKQFEDLDNQSEVILYLLSVVERYIQSGKLQWSTLKKIEGRIKISSQYIFLNLIDVIYMQFYILLSENEKKICPICNTPFLPERKDKIYCSSSCKLTAKSQRYRARKNTQTHS